MLLRADLLTGLMKKKKGVTPENVVYPVAWPAAVSIRKSPSDWTMNDMWRLIAWLKECGDFKGTPYVDGDIYLHATKVLGALKDAPPLAGEKRKRG